ncbi:MAG: transcriptional regulator [Pseudonocardiales bacterium]|nr:transcriptional regulator [Pseudonocardiales bacterium]
MQQDRAFDGDPDARAQLSKLYSLFALSMLMFAAHEDDAILKLAATAIPSLGPFLVIGGYLVDGRMLRPVQGGGLDATVQTTLLGADTAEIDLSVPGSRWTRAFRLQDRGGTRGFLLVGSPVEPAIYETFLVKVLVQETAASIGNAALYREATEATERLRRLNEERARVNEDLSLNITDLKRQRHAHEVLAQVSANGLGVAGLATALHELTGMAAAIEDPFGTVKAWASDNEPEYEAATPEDHAELQQHASHAEGRATRFNDRLVVVVRQGSEPLGAIALLDPRRVAGAHEIFALEHAAVMLAVELSHQRSVAEIEHRLRRDLVDELITGMDDDSAVTRAASVGHDLRGRNWVAVLRWNEVPEETMIGAVERAVRDLGAASLTARRSGLTVLILSERPNHRALYDAISRAARSRSGTLGMGGCADAPHELPRSYQQALRAFTIREQSRVPYGAAAFDELGIYRILGTGEASHEVEAFVREWLGRLLDYDAKRHTELVKTLSHYLDCGGNYDHTAEALVIHRSTLRYRLRRIRDLTGIELTDVDSRLNLHVATRAWRLLNGGL